MRKLFCAAVMLLMGTLLNAQEAEIFRLEAEVRVDYEQEYQLGNKINDVSGFHGQYLNLRMDGKIAEGLTYSWKQRMNKANTVSSFFNATDWVTVDYTVNKWSLSAGKQVVAIGGYEYDMAPIDCYFNSEYWNNIACYQFGVSAAYAVGNKGDKLMFQFCESPFKRYDINVENKETFAYNLMWFGSHGIFNALYSLNMIEYMPGRYINYIVFGNKFTVNDFDLELDVMNRAVALDELFGKDMSVMADFSWQAFDKLNIFAKITYDFNKSKHIGDLCVTPGTDIVRVGGGLEYYPLKSTKNLRLHLTYCYTDGKAADVGVLRPQQSIIDAGVTWRMKLLNLKRNN